MGNYEGLDFSCFTDLELVVLQHKAREFPEDQEFVDAVMEELKNRIRMKDEQDEASTHRL